MSTWYTADLHLGHRLVAEHRGFLTADLHDDAITHNWRCTVAPKDTVYVLGDISVGYGGDALDRLSDLPGVKHLIAGNHDPVHPMHRRSRNAQRAWLDVFESVQAFARKRIAGRDVLLSHFPYTLDRGETRHPQWRLPDLGSWLLHGHTHGQERLHDHEVHVGLDAWDLRPVPESTIEALMNEAEGGMA